jgi:hypothetical protein
VPNLTQPIFKNEVYDEVSSLMVVTLFKKMEDEGENGELSVIISSINSSVWIIE